MGKQPRQQTFMACTIILVVPGAFLLGEEPNNEWLHSANLMREQNDTRIIGSLQPY